MSDKRKINGGGPAFPESGSRGQAAFCEGMTLRDRFAAKAMQALIARGPKNGPEQIGEALFRVSRTSYKYADAMLRAREKGGAE